MPSGRVKTLRCSGSAIEVDFIKLISSSFVSPFGGVCQLQNSEESAAVESSRVFDF